MYFNGQTFSSVFEQFSFTSKIFGLKMQKSTFLRKNGFKSSFYKIDVLMVTNWSVRLEKHQTIEILLLVDFYAFLKCCIFQNFSRFLKFGSISWYNCYMHLILFEHCRPNTVEFDKSIFGD